MTQYISTITFSMTLHTIWLFSSKFYIALMGTRNSNDDLTGLKIAEELLFIIQVGSQTVAGISSFPFG